MYALLKLNFSYDPFLYWTEMNLDFHDRVTSHS